MDLFFFEDLSKETGTKQPYGLLAVDKLHERYESFQKILEVMKGLEQAMRAQEESAKTQKLIVEQLIVKKDERKD